MRILLYSLMFNLFLVALGHADTLQLLDGRTLKGDIVEQDSTRVVFKDEQGRISNFYRDQIITVVEGEVISPITIDPLQFSGMNAEKVKSILRLLEANGMRANIEKNMRYAIEDAPEAQRPALAKLFNVNEIVAELIPIYDRRFTHEEILALVSFYESPAGVKMLKESAPLIKEVTEATLQYFQKKLTDKK